ncbi:hypothetical protein B296_00034301 [Ensete ventricosum]|uniref:Uncharacterized protein n=1 Tax=Ensete ventricosum TaxID=4639 RepID=A0A426YX64_ENSVE|nr:hypothetical protein B296_00034301 [Ensete ventricosum]
MRRSQASRERSNLTSHPFHQPAYGLETTVGPALGDLLEGVYVYSIGPHDFVPITVEAVERVGEEAVRLRRSPRQQREVVQSSMGPSLKRSASYMA